MFKKFEKIFYYKMNNKNERINLYDYSINAQLNIIDLMRENLNKYKILKIFFISINKKNL